jgi:hypothetical protein
MEGQTSPQGEPGVRFVVTTCRDPSEAHEARGRTVAERCGVPFVKRDTSIKTIRARHGVELLYEVRRIREELQTLDECLFVHPGLFYFKRIDGREHPLLRAVAPQGEPPLERIVDATLGLCSDALHLAHVLPQAEVLGIERSPLLYSLQQEGLARMQAERRGWSPAAGRIQPLLGDAREVLAGMPDQSADVVYLDPMFEEPRGAGGAFALMRVVACHDPLDQATLDQACRVARRRVVVKRPGRAPLPAVTPWGAAWEGATLGISVDYLVATNPSWSAPRDP